MRLPDFVVLGTMKSGTTTLYNWLGQQPDVFVPARKELFFFSRDEDWKRGLRWYAKQFSGADQTQRIVDTSGTLTNPDKCALCARRLSETLPRARLVFMARHPIERMRSHYRHWVQRNTESQPFLEALRQPGNPYVRVSMYYSSLLPFLERYPRKSICILRTEDLEDSGWDRLMTFFGLQPRPRPTGRYNVTEEKSQFTKLGYTLWKRGALHWARRVPKPVRHLGKRVVFRESRRYRSSLEDSLAPVPEDVGSVVWADVSKLESWLGVEEPLWRRGPNA
jgi:hypothetical protein